MGRRRKKKWWQRNNKQKGNGMSIDKDNKVTPIAAGRELSDEEFEKLKAEHDKGGAFKKQVVAQQNCWDAGIEILNHECSKVNVPQYHIEFDPLAHQKISKLKSYYPSLEWLAYLVGDVDHENAKVSVDDLVIPDSQQVTGVSVYNVEYSWPALPDGKKIIGVIHSHHSMGAFFSGTDDAYINQNHDVSIVVSTAKGREIKSQVRVKVPCDAYVLAEDITYSVKQAQVLDEDEFEKEFKEKINSYTPPVIRYASSGYNYLGNYGRGYYNGSFYGNTYGGRGSSNPPRNSQMNLYEEEYDLLDELDDEYPNPFTMTREDVVDHLLDYYAEEEVDEFMKKGLDFAKQELYVVQKLCMGGVDTRRLTEVDEEILELDALGENEEWTTGEDDSRDTNKQNGMHQVSYGVPLKDQMEENDGWSTGEEDLTEDNKDDIIVNEVIHTQDGVMINPNGVKKTNTTH